MPESLNTIQKYSISLMWCNLCHKEVNETIWGSEDIAGRYLSPVIKWSLANPRANIIYWYDSKFTTKAAIQRSKQLMNFYQERHKLPNSIVFADIRSLKVVKLNPTLFSELVPGYLRIDLLKLIILVHEIVNDNMDAAIYADHEVGDQSLGGLGIRKSETELFDVEMMKLHCKYALINGLSSNYIVENQYFQLTKDPHMAQALIYLINSILEECTNFINKVRAKKDAKLSPEYVWHKLKEGLHWQYYFALRKVSDPTIGLQLKKNTGLGIAAVNTYTRRSKREFYDGISDREQRCLRLKTPVVLQPWLLAGQTYEQYLQCLQEISEFTSPLTENASDPKQDNRPATNVPLNDVSETAINLLHTALKKNDKKKALALLADNDSLFRQERHSVSVANSLILAGELKFNAVVKALLQIGVDVNTRNNLGRTLLHISCSKENQALFQMLLKMPNLNIDARDNMGRNCLYYLYNLTIDELLKLKEYGVDFNIYDAVGNNLLHYTARDQNYSVCKYLLARGFDPNQRNYKGEMPLDLTHLSLNREQAILFLKRGARLPMNPFPREYMLNYLSLNPYLTLHLCINEFKDYWYRKFQKGTFIFSNEFQKFILSDIYEGWWKKLDKQRRRFVSRYFPNPNPEQNAKNMKILRRNSDLANAFLTKWQEKKDAISKRTINPAPVKNESSTPKLMHSHNYFKPKKNMHSPCKQYSEKVPTVYTAHRMFFSAKKANFLDINNRFSLLTDNDNMPAIRLI